jgi:hypothetical protein
MNQRKRVLGFRRSQQQPRRPEEGSERALVESPNPHQPRLGGALAELEMA